MLYLKQTTFFIQTVKTQQHIYEKDTYKKKINVQKPLKLIENSSIQLIWTFIFVYCMVTPSLNSTLLLKPHVRKWYHPNMVLLYYETFRCKFSFPWFNSQITFKLTGWNHLFYMISLNFDITCCWVVSKSSGCKLSHSFIEQQTERETRLSPLGFEWRLFPVIISKSYWFTDLNVCLNGFLTGDSKKQNS